MAWEITTEDLLKRYTSGKRNFAGAAVIRDSEVGRNFIDLEGAVLRDINLRGADLSFANLRGSDLTGADLFGAFLTEACLDSAIIRDANLEGVNLSRCDLTNADLTGSLIYCANAILAKFCGAKLTRFGDVILIKANFRGATPALDHWICRGTNVVWNTILPDGTLVKGPYFGNWEWMRK